MDDLISRRAAIEALGERPMVWTDSDYEIAQRNQYDMDRLAIETVPSAQPDEEKVSNILYNIYRNTSPHTSAEGVAAVKYYIREIYREIYGEEGPKWLKK